MTGEILAYSRNAGMFVQADIVIFSEWPKSPDPTVDCGLRTIFTSGDLLPGRDDK
jgi:hypothetical protein